MPRPHTREEWASYQAIILDHLRRLRSAAEVRDHDTARRHFLGEDPSTIEANVRAQLDWWDTVRMLDDMQTRKPQDDGQCMCAGCRGEFKPDGEKRRVEESKESA